MPRMIVKQVSPQNHGPMTLGFFLIVALAAVAAGAWTFVLQDARDDGGKNRKSLESILKDNEWGAITAPVFDQRELTSGYEDEAADLFAGPEKFRRDKELPCRDNYFCGVLPNGRIVKPEGESIQVGTNPLGVALTPDGKYLITSNDDERESGFSSYKSEINRGGYSLSVVDTASLKVVSHLSTGRFFIGLQVTGKGPYTVWASGGPDNDVKMMQISEQGLIKAGPISIPIRPRTPANQGFVSNYASDFKPVPTGFASAEIHTTFPAGLALSPNGKFLYVACNGDNRLAVIDTEKAIGNPARAVVASVEVGYFPYAVSVSPDGSEVAVSNWGVTEYKFANVQYNSNENLTQLDRIADGRPHGFYVPVTDTAGTKPKTSSVSILEVPNGDGSKISLLRSFYQGHELDEINNVGDTHPSAMGIVARGKDRILYVTKSNSDKLGAINLNTNQPLNEIDLSPFFPGGDNLKLRGAYPNALAVSPDNLRMYVAEAGTNSVAVLDASDPFKPSLLGRIPTGWYPSGVAVSPDGNMLYVANAKGIGEDINLRTQDTKKAAPPTGLASDRRGVDSNYVFGTIQKITLKSIALRPDDHRIESYNFAYHPAKDMKDINVVPVGGGRSKRITHVFFILHENKTFDSMLGSTGNLPGHFRNFSSTIFNDVDGKQYSDSQYTGVARNTQMLATTFATAVNYYSDSEESDAGHQFAASGTASDYTEKTLLVKNGRGLLVNKNFEPEDYPEHGYIFNNAARNGVSFKDYGALIRIVGTDTGESTLTALNDPGNGKLGYPVVSTDGVSTPLRNAGDVDSPVMGLGQSYFLKTPILAILGTKNSNGEDRLDHNYPGYNFNISDQRRAREFINDFDRMVQQGTLPQFLYIYQPNDHTGFVQAPNAKDVVSEATRPQQQVADGDVALGMVVEHIMKSKAYYDPQTGEGSAIFITWDDAQSTRDHIHPHRTPLIVVSPYARRSNEGESGYIARHHYSTASIVKTEELFLGLPPNNLGDLLATDLRDMFTDKYNGITADQLTFTRTFASEGSPEGKRIWTLVSRLDTSAPDRDSFRLGELARLSMAADELHKTAAEEHRLRSVGYRAKQIHLYKQAVRLVNTSAPRDADD